MARVTRGVGSRGKGRGATRGKGIAKQSESAEVRDLYKANKKTIGKNPNLIHPGEKITRGDGSSYTVKKGDNLYKIARGTPKAKGLVKPSKSGVNPHTDLMGKPQSMPHRGRTGGSRVSPPSGGRSVATSGAIKPPSSAMSDPHTTLMGRPQKMGGGVPTARTGNVPGPVPPQKIGPSSPNGDTGLPARPAGPRVGAPGASPTPSIKTPGKAKEPNASARARQVASPRAAFNRKQA